MRYGADHKEKTRVRILAAAGRLFRRGGYHATGVDRVMEEAGLTAGGFYAHFASKRELLAETLTHVGEDSRSRHAEALTGLSGPAWIDAFLARYLSATHRETPAEGCPLVALAAEVARSDDDEARTRFEAIVRDLADTLSAHSGRRPGPEAEARALAAVALCVGGMGIARAVRDDPLASRILETCRHQAAEMLRIDGPPTAAGGR